jgi:hypothetical protein
MCDGSNNAAEAPLSGQQEQQQQQQQQQQWPSWL